MAVEITSSEELKKWLVGKPRGWMDVLAHRTALRAAVWAFDPKEWSEGGPVQPWVLHTFRALILHDQFAFLNHHKQWSLNAVSDRLFEIKFSPAPFAFRASNRAVAAGDLASLCATLDYLEVFKYGLGDDRLSLGSVLDDLGSGCIKSLALVGAD